MLRAREPEPSFAQYNLTPDRICRSISDAAPVGVAEPSAPRFAGIGVRSYDRTAGSGCGRLSVGPTLGEEHDATGSSQRPCSTARSRRKLGEQQLLARCAAYNPNISAGSERKGHALSDSEIILVCTRNPSPKTKMQGPAMLECTGAHSFGPDPFPAIDRATQIASVVRIGKNCP
jgi:hypothetical protein